MKGCRFKGEGEELHFHISSASSELLTVETISMNLGRNEVLMIPYKCCISK
jgi:hypothetical protein